MVDNQQTMGGYGGSTMGKPQIVDISDGDDRSSKNEQKSSIQGIAVLNLLDIGIIWSFI